MGNQRADDRKAITNVLWVEPTLANALDMWDEKTTPKDLFRYAAENAELPSHVYNGWERQVLPATVWFLVDLVLALTPPDHKRMSFRDRPPAAAKAAVPYDFGDVITVLMGIGWGSMGVSGRTVRDVGTEMRDLLDRKARELARSYLERWESQGVIYQL